MKGIEARRQANAIAKQVKALKGSKDLEAIGDLLADTQELKDKVYPLYETAENAYWENETDENSEEFNRFYMAHESLSRSESRLEYWFDELYEIQQERIARKREEKVCKGWIAA